MMADLATYERPVSDLFAGARSDADLCLTDEQVEFFRNNGYLSGVRILSDDQIDALRSELKNLMRPEQVSNPHFYEFHLNESTDR
jgi:hypothetical protein